MALHRPEQQQAPPGVGVGKPDEHGELQLLKVTSRSHQEPYVEVVAADLSAGRLKTTSYIRTNHCIVVHQSLVKHVGVRLASHKLAEVHRSLALTSTRQFARLQHAQLRPAADPDRTPWVETALSHWPGSWQKFLRPLRPP